MSCLIQSPVKPLTRLEEPILQTVSAEFANKSSAVFILSGSEFRVKLLQQASKRFKVNQLQELKLWASIDIVQLFCLEDLGRRLKSICRFFIFNAGDGNQANTPFAKPRILSRIAGFPYLLLIFD